jgi:hypothetical protein
MCNFGNLQQKPTPVTASAIGGSHIQVFQPQSPRPEESRKIVKVHRKTHRYISFQGEQNFGAGSRAEQGIPQSCLGRSHQVTQVLVLGQLANEGQHNGKVFDRCRADARFWRVRGRQCVVVILKKPLHHRGTGNAEKNKLLHLSTYLPEMSVPPVSELTDMSRFSLPLCGAALRFICPPWPECAA